MARWLNTTKATIYCDLRRTGGEKLVKTHPAGAPRLGIYCRILDFAQQ